MSLDVSAMSMDELRALRARSRREAELVRLRSRQDGARTDANGDVEELQARVDMLTGELIARYAADLSLVDSLLGEAYPARVTRKSVR